MEPTEDQIKRLWEWCGVEPEKMTRQIVGCETADGRKFAGGCCTEDVYPELDLNNLFKYAVPKLVKTGYKIGIAVRETTRARICKEAYTTLSVAEDKDPALALFWAIWEIVDAFCKRP